MSQPPRTRPPARRVAGGSQPPPPARRSSAPARRDPFPYILGGILTVVLVGIVFVVVFLLSQNTNPNGVAQVPPVATGTSIGDPPVKPGVTTIDPNVTAGPTSEPPPRMPLAEFKALYDDPAKRPLIIDVRAKEAFDAGHIKGSQSWPEADIDATNVKLPKDKLIVAYCQ